MSQRTEFEAVILGIRQEFQDSKVNARRELAAALGRYDESSRAAFCEAISLAEELGVSRARLADEFRVSEGTISRWIRGETAPPAYSRDAVSKRLGHLIEADDG